MKNTFRILFVLTILAISFSSAVVCSTEKELAESAEKAGKWREALAHYTVALQEAYKNKSSTKEIKEKIFAAYVQVDPKPALPDEARRHLMRGEAAVEMAKDAKDLQEAVDELIQAFLIAPWNAKTYYNLGVLRDKQGFYGRAIENFQCYLKLSPNASDAEQVKDQITKLEFKKEKAEQAASEKQAKYAKFDFLLGDWSYQFQAPLVQQWGTLTMTLKGDTLEGFQTLKGWRYANVPEAYATGHPSEEKTILLLRGTLNGPDPANVKWEAWRIGGPPDGCSYRDGFVETAISVSPDPKRISFSYPFARNQMYSGALTCSEDSVEYVLTRS